MPKAIPMIAKLPKSQKRKPRTQVKGKTRVGVSYVVSHKKIETKLLFGPAESVTRTTTSRVGAKY